MTGIDLQAETHLTGDWTKDAMAELDNIEQAFINYRHGRSPRWRVLMDSLKPVVNVLLTVSDVGGEFASSQVGLFSRRYHKTT